MAVEESGMDWFVSAGCEECGCAHADLEVDDRGRWFVGCIVIRSSIMMGISKFKTNTSYSALLVCDPGMYGGWNIPGSRPGSLILNMSANRGK